VRAAHPAFEGRTVTYIDLIPYGVDAMVPFLEGATA
jgi:hypothetical protein